MSVETRKRLLGPREIAIEMFGDETKWRFVAARMRSGEWEHTPAGRSRFMTAEQIDAAIEAMKVPAREPDQPPASGLSPKSRRRRTH